jgi:hypothetical protein
VGVIEADGRLTVFLYIGTFVTVGLAILGWYVLPTPTVFPELGRLSSTWERRKMLRRAAQAASEGAAALLFTMSFLCLVVVFVYAASTLVGVWFNKAPLLLAFLGLVLATWSKGLPGRRAAIRRHLRRYLNGMGLRTCLACGYDLTGNRSDTCPECGTAIEGAACLPVP